METIDIIIELVLPMVSDCRLYRPIDYMEKSPSPVEGARLEIV